MKFKPKKSRSLSLRKGEVNQNINFMVGGQRIPAMSEESVKSLGRRFNEGYESSERKIQNITRSFRLDRSMSIKKKF